jgi:parallel beta-helix repeat protein
MLTNVNVLGSGTINNFAFGLHAENSANSSVKFVNVNANCPDGATGFEIDTPGGHWMLQGNVVRGPGDTSAGIVLFQVNNNVVVRNDVNDSITIFRGSNNIITNNVGNDNFNGIFLLRSNNNQIHANTTSNNVDNSGIWIFEGSVGNTISGNTSFNNSPFDMEDDNFNCGGNRWQGNHFNTASQPCIH